MYHLPDNEYILPHEFKTMRQKKFKRYIKFITPEQINLLPKKSFDIAINTNSFHEMSKNEIKNYFKIMRKSHWAGEINTKILVFNSLEDKVVDARKTTKLLKNNKNIKIINLTNIKHEIFMEKDSERSRLWSIIDDFLKI